MYHFHQWYHDLRPRYRSCKSTSCWALASIALQYLSLFFGEKWKKAFFHCQKKNIQGRMDQKMRAEGKLSWVHPVMSHTTPSKVIILNKTNWANIKGPNIASHFDTIPTMMRGVCCSRCNDPGLCHRCKPFPLLFNVRMWRKCTKTFRKVSLSTPALLGKNTSASHPG